MKKLILALFMTTALFAQENINTITVSGQAEKKISVDTYVVNIALKEVLADGYQQLEPKKLAEVTKEYSAKLQSVGIDFKKFEPNTIIKIYSSYSDNSDSKYYTFVTTSEEEIQKVLRQKIQGLTIYNVEVKAKDKTNDELAALSDTAIKDAKIKAQKIAEKTGRKLGKITKIEDSNTKEQYIDSYRANTPQKHTISVTFSLE